MLLAKILVIIFAIMAILFIAAYMYATFVGSRIIENIVNILSITLPIVGIINIIVLFI